MPYTKVVPKVVAAYLLLWQHELMSQQLICDFKLQSSPEAFVLEMTDSCILKKAFIKKLVCQLLLSMY